MSPAKKQATRLRIRDFREGDEKEIAAIYGAYMQGFVGPEQLTPKSWRDQYRRQGWSAPSLDADRRRGRVAVVGRQVVGYAISDHAYMWDKDTAVVQELCVREGDDADGIAEALLADAEAQARERGKLAIMLVLSNDDGRALRAARARGIDAPEDGGGVFMAAIIDLAKFLREIEAELTRRLAESRFREWEGSIRLSSGEMKAGLRLRGGKARATAVRGRPRLSVTVHPEALPRLMLGQLAVGEAYLQDWLSIGAAHRAEALAVLDVLFPRAPLYLPRAQWW